MLEAREFWDRKILKWENMRYSRWTLLYPLSWTLRKRLALAAASIVERVSEDQHILELGCGSGLLADRLKKKYSKYTGVDIAPAAIRKAQGKLYPRGYSFQMLDVAESELPAADCAVFLGLTDWLKKEDLRSLFARLQVRNILFSYTDAAALSPYRAYRAVLDEPKVSPVRKARNYAAWEIAEMLADAGFDFEHIRRAGALDPGALIWASKSE